MKNIIVFLFLLSSNLFFAQETTILKKEDVNSVKIGDPNGDLDVVPITVLEKTPIFPGCENIPQNEKHACFNKMINNHIVKNMVYPREMLDLEIQGRVNVSFIINKEGNVENIQTKGGHVILQKEAKRIISTLPKITPGFQKGKPVKVRYSVPITFKLQ